MRAAGVDEEGGPRRLVDLHTHLMPGVDDGARTADQAREALEALDDAGVSVAVATPHADASHRAADPDDWERRLRELDEAWDRLLETARSVAPGLRLERAVEMRLDARDPAFSDARVRLGGTSFVLVEFDTLRLPPFGADQISEVERAGWRPVLAHPERYRGLERRIDEAAAWRDAGALLQVNAGSLVGQYGPDVRRTAWRLLERGWVELVASDYHARGEPRLEAAWSALERAGGGSQAELLMRRNPGRVLEDRSPVTVPPLERRRGILERLQHALGLG